MESRTRTFVKAVTWQLVGLVTMTVLVFIVTGDLGSASGLALLASATGFVCFLLHERIWAHITWGRR